MNDDGEHPENAPDHCPGTSSKEAGKATPCAGCPNQSICSSGVLRDQAEPSSEAIYSRMSNVKHKILILSGKGGVGKSTFSALLAQCLSKNFQVALLDVDICGPSQPKMMGVEDEQVHQSLSGWSPVFVDENLCMMSVGFLLGNADEAVVWRGPKKNGLIKRFLKDVDWGPIDFMIIDTPPGTSDEHLSLAQFLLNPKLKLDGAILITTPQEVALQDVRKEASFCRKIQLPLIGLVENLSVFVCPCCHRESIIFPRSMEDKGSAGFWAEACIDFLGTLPIDPNVARCCDQGLNYCQAYPEAVVTKAMIEIAEKIVHFCEKQ